MQTRFHHLARLNTLAFLLAAALFSCRHAAAQSYTLTAIGDLGGNHTIALSINNSAQVVGYSYLKPPGGIYHAFMWQNGVMTDLLDTPGGTLSRATAINDSGQIVGYEESTLKDRHTGISSTYIIGFLLDKGVWTGIPTFGGQESEAYAINRDGQIVGSASFPNKGRDGFLWQNGTMTDLDDLGIRGLVAYGINNAGQVVGESRLPDGQLEAFLWQSGVMHDIGNLGGDSSVATGINDSGQVVGYAITADGAEHAFLWQNGVVTDLAIIQGFTSKADGINKAGQIVGYSEPPGGLTKATIWQNGVMTDLNTLIPAGTGWQLEEALSINDAGQIVGYGEINGNNLSFLLTPYPTANPQTVLVDLGRPTAITLTGVDYDNPPLPLTIALAAQPTNGKLTGLKPTTGEVTYTPNIGFKGADSFTFTVSNGAATSAAATVTLKVAIGTPTASPQTVTIARNTAANITLTGTDPDSPAPPLAFAIKSSPAHGSLGTLNTSTGEVTYTPSGSFGGTDSLTFTVSNGSKTSAPATVTLKVMPGTPAANAQTVAVAHNTGKSITLTGEDSDVPALPLTYSIAKGPAHGALGTLNTSTGVVTYTPSAGFCGTDTLTFTVSNGTNTSADATVILNVTAGIPTANAQTLAVSHNTAKMITLTGTDSDNPALPLKFTIATSPAHGVLGSLNTATGAVKYTPSSTFSGKDSFTFTVSNKANTSAAATVTLDVSAGTPTAKAQTVTVLHNTAAAITLTGTDPDIPALKLTFAIVAAPANGALSGLNATTGAVKYTPKANFQGADSFTFTVSNGTNTSAAATVKLKVAPGTPIAKPQTVTVALNTKVTITLTGSDPDVPALPLRFAIASQPAHGVLGSLNAATGVLAYTPNAKYKGTDTFTFTVSNGTNKSAAAAVTLKVGG